MLLQLPRFVSGVAPVDDLVEPKVLSGVALVTVTREYSLVRIVTVVVVIIFPGFVYFYRFVIITDASVVVRETSTFQVGQGVSEGLQENVFHKYNDKSMSRVVDILYN